VRPRRGRRGSRRRRRRSHLVQGHPLATGPWLVSWGHLRKRRQSAPPRFADKGGQNAPSLAAAEKQGKEFLEGLEAKDIAAGRALSADRLQKAAGPGLGR